MPWSYCVTRNGNRNSTPHKERHFPAPQILAKAKNRAWWKSMAEYEGQFAKPRPTWLEVPSTEELCKEAGAVGDVQPASESGVLCGRH